MPRLPAEPRSRPGSSSALRTRVVRFSWEAEPQRPNCWPTELPCLGRSASDAARPALFRQTGLAALSLLLGRQWWADGTFQRCDCGLRQASTHTQVQHLFNCCKTKVEDKKWTPKKIAFRFNNQHMEKKHIVFFFSRQNKKQTFTVFTFKAGFAGLITDTVSSIRAAELHLSKYFR